MTEPNSTDSYELPDEERRRIRAEMRYAAVIAKEAAQTNAEPKPKSGMDKVLGYLSNGFILLIIGAIITSGLVPYFQRKYENRKERYALMQECFAQFLLYSNSIWQEYYAILPLTQEVEIGKNEYLQYVKEIAQIKLKRYEAYAKVQALSIVFGTDTPGDVNPVKSALEHYAIDLNIASAAIDKWLTGLYCTPTVRDRSPCASFDPTFDAFEEFEEIKSLVIEIGNSESDNVAAIIAAEMKQGN